MYKIVLDGKCDTMNILVETGIFGSVSKDSNYSDGNDVYIYIYTSITYKMQVETIIYGQIISHGERVINLTYLTKLRHGSKWYTQIDGTEVVIILHIIVHPKLQVSPRLC